MARQVRRLTALDVRQSGPGRHHDGAGLYLHVHPSGARYWSFRYGAGGKRSVGLGPAHTVSLNEARDKANACRQLLIEGRDPQRELNARRQALKAEASRVTFTEAADAYHAAHCAKWAAKHAREVRETLRALVEPLIGSIAVDAIDTPEVLRALQPVWRERPKAAPRIRQRIEAVLDFARVHNWRSGDNPARWRGHLDMALPRAHALAPVKHHAALHYADVPEFVRSLRGLDDVGARYIEFAILTGVRSSEARLAEWGEVDGDTWAIPARRMKQKREHRVPLSAAARAVLDGLRGKSGSNLIFAGRSGRPVGKSTFIRLTIIRRGAVTLHGFRASFKTWAEEETGFASKVIEAALAHRVGDSETERAYMRGTLFEKRRALMEAWGSYCGSIDKVTQLAGRRRV
jgi:integrase